MATLTGKDDVSYTISATDVSRTAVDSALSNSKRLEGGFAGLQAKMKNQFAMIQKHWLAMAAAAYAAAQALRGAWNLMEGAADYQERINSLNALGAQYKMTGDQIVRSMKEASRGLLSMQEAADMAAAALNLSLSPKQMIEFTQVAESLTDVIGGTIPEAFNRMTVAAATGRLQTLAQMGIIVDLKRAYEDWAAANNRTVESLTEAEKQQIRLNGILDAAKQKVEALGPVQDTVRDKMDRLAASVKDMQLFMGQIFIRSMMAATGAFQWLASGVTSVMSALTKLRGIWMQMRLFTDRLILSPEAKKQLESDIADIKGTIQALNESAIDLAGKAAENMQAAFASAKELATVMQSAAQPAVAGPQEGSAVAAGNAAFDKDAWLRQVQREADVQALREKAERIRMENELITSGVQTEIETVIDARQAEMDAYTLSSEYKMALLQTEHDMALLMIQEETEAEIRQSQVKQQVTNDAVQNSINALRLFAEKNRAAFEAWKIASAAEAAIASFKAATKAYDALAGIPYIGPALGAAAAAAALAFGAAQVANIMSQQYDSVNASGLSGGRSAVGTYPASPTTGAPEKKPEEKYQGASININIYGNVMDQDKLSRELIPSIQKALADGVH